MELADIANALNDCLVECKGATAEDVITALLAVAVGQCIGQGELHGENSQVIYDRCMARVNLLTMEVAPTGPPS